MAAVRQFIHAFRPELVGVAIAIPAYWVLFSGIAAWIGALSGVMWIVIYLRRHGSASAEQQRGQSSKAVAAAKNTRLHAA